jgi:hypothetical protein
MFVFDNASDKDARSYGYELYEASQVSGSYPNISPITNATIYSSGTSGSNVFTVAVENSTDSTTTRYFGRIRTIDSSNNPSSWSPIVQSDQENPLISNQYIASLTAAKITAGTIGAHEIVLTQAGAATAYSAPANTAVIRSSNYSADTAGWLIRGDGFAEFDQAAIRGTIRAGAVFIDEHNRWKANTTGSVISTAEFKVGNATKYLYWDGTNLTFTGNLSAAGGTFSGDLSAAGGTFSGQLSGGTISIGSGNSIFKADSSGIYLGNSTFSSAPFRVTPQGSLVASNANITGTINATSGNISGDLITGGTISGTSIDINNGAFQVNSDGSLTATNADITGEINATSGSISGNLLVGGTISSTDITGVNISGVNIDGSTITVGGRILLPTDGGQILLGTASGGSATQVYIFAEGSQGVYIDTSGLGSSWFSGATWYINLQEFVSGRYITGLKTFVGSGTTLVVDSDGYVNRASSKRELKDNIQDFSDISLIDNLKPVTFIWKKSLRINRDETEEERLRRESSINIGFIAEEVEEASDGLLSIYNHNEDGEGEVEMYKHLDLLALAVASIQDLRKRVLELEKQ